MVASTSAVRPPVVTLGAILKPDAPSSVSDPLESVAVVLAKDAEVPRLARVCELPPRSKIDVPVIDRELGEAMLAPVPKVIEPALIVVVPV